MLSRVAPRVSPNLASGEGRVFYFAYWLFYAIGRFCCYISFLSFPVVLGSTAQKGMIILSF